MEKVVTLLELFPSAAAAALMAALATAPATAQAPAIHAVIHCGSLSGKGQVHIHAEGRYLGTVTVNCSPA
jgi:hypothetical protein